LRVGGGSTPSNKHMNTMIYNLLFLNTLLTFVAAEKKAASATMSVTATVVETSENATDVIIHKTYDENGVLIMITYIYKNRNLQ
jgi:hypothetical protein